MNAQEVIRKIRAEIKERIALQKDLLKQAEDSARIEGSIDALQGLLNSMDTFEEPVEKTCKTCGFYENNCPFIRDKFIPYPNKVCKDYTFSTLKAEQEPVSEDLEEATEGEWNWATTPPEKPGKYKVQLRYDTYSAIWNGVKWIDDASGFPIMGVFKWKPIKE